MILDTCALLWLSQQPQKLSARTLRKIDKAAVVYISSITGFEISLKARSGKLILPVPPQAWLQTVLEHHDIAVIGLDLGICIKATELPPIHSDPCDRFIIATATLRDLPVVTADAHFQEYGVRVLA